jgi:hypothetical protein
MAALELSASIVTRDTGLDSMAVRAALFSCGAQVDHEIVCIIDELLDKLEGEREAEALEHGPRRQARAMQVPGRGDLVPVACDLEALLGCSVAFPGKVPR